MKRRIFFSLCIIILVLAGLSLRFLLFRIPAEREPFRSLPVEISPRAPEPVIEELPDTRENAALPPAGAAESETRTSPLSLRLLGTIVRKDGVSSKALIENPLAGTRQFYGVGQRIEGLTIAEVRPDEILLADGEMFFTLRLSSRPGEVSLAPEPTPEEAQTALKEIGNRYISRWQEKAASSAEAVGQEIKSYLDELNRFWTIVHGPEDRPEELKFPDTRQVAENTWAVKEDDALRAARNARQIMGQVNLVPYQPTGNSASTQGFQVKIVKPDSVWEQMGFQNGDILTQVNDRPVRSLADLIPAARAAQADGYARVEVVRNNQPVVLYYYVTK